MTQFNTRYNLSFAMIALFATTSCGPINLTLGGPTGGQITNGGAARFSDQISQFNYRLPAKATLQSPAIPLTLQWVTPKSLNADYNIQICSSNEADCRTEFTVFCTDRYLCSVKLSDGTPLTGFHFTKSEVVNNRNYVTFNLGICNFGSGALPDKAVLRIQPVVSTELKALVAGTLDNSISGGTCLPSYF